MAAKVQSCKAEASSLAGFTGSYNVPSGGPALETAAGWHRWNSFSSLELASRSLGNTKETNVQFIQFQTVCIMRDDFLSLKH